MSARVDCCSVVVSQTAGRRIFQMNLAAVKLF